MAPARHSQWKDSSRLNSRWQRAPPACSSSSSSSSSRRSTQRHGYWTPAQQGASGEDALRARSNYVRILSRLGRKDDADAQLKTLHDLVPDPSATSARYLLSSARSTSLIARGEYANAVPELETAIASLRELEPDSTALLDSLRLDLVACQALSEQHERARAEATALIAEAQGREDDSALIVALAPGLAIAVSVMALNVFGDGLRDALDPRSKVQLGRT